jgi:hypothetical protein
MASNNLGPVCDDSSGDGRQRPSASKLLRPAKRDTSRYTELATTDRRKTLARRERWLPGIAKINREMIFTEQTESRRDP